MKISEEDFYDFKEKLIVETVEDFVPRDQAYAWVDKNVLGGINKELLDQQRLQEINQLDMMQNTSIVYHTESLLEMQFLCLLMSTILQKWFSNVDFEDSENILMQDTIILVALGIEHVLSYSAAIFRKWDIERNGQIDLNGIYRAPNESILAQIEV